MPEESAYFIISDEWIYLDLRDSMGYTDEMEKLKRNNSKLILKIELRNPLTKKWGFVTGYRLWVNICICCQKWTNIRIQNVFNNFTRKWTWRMRKQYIRKAIWHLGGKKENKKGVF